MEFTLLTESEYRSFWENHPLKFFLCAPEIATIREQNGWHSEFVGVKENDNILCATLLFSIVRHFGKKEFYSPSGYLIDFHNKQLVEFFTNALKEYVYKNNGYALRIAPNIIYKQRDIDGNVVEGGIDNSDVVQHLLSLGFKQGDVSKTEQITWMFSLDLENKTEDQILKEMKQNTRNIIRKTEKIGIVNKELSYDELDEFYKIYQETGARKNFAIRDLSYYQQMYKLFHDKGEVKFYVTYLNLVNYINNLQTEVNQKVDKLSKLNDSKRNDGLKKTLNEDIENLNKKIKEAEDIRNKTSLDVISLSGSMFVLIQPEIVYLSSGNYEEYMKFNSQYLIQWELIKYGISHGFKKHNFYGIPANINTHPKDYGIYLFKRGFNGYVEELIGEFELPIRKEYYLIKSLSKLKDRLKYHKK